MISLWVLLNEKEMDNYVKTLILPEYMSHLSVCPFRFSQQTPNTTGREPLIVAYSGDCRLEEILLTPEKHALAMIDSLRQKPDRNKILLSTDAIWTWPTIPGAYHGSVIDRFNENRFKKNGLERQVEDQSDSGSSSLSMRIYIHPIVEPEVTFTDRFPTEWAYISVSRGELFISRTIIAKYIEQYCLLLMDQTENDSHRNPGKSPGKDEKTQPVFEMSTVSGGYAFQLGSIAGEMIINTDDEIERIMASAGLLKAIQQLSVACPVNWQNGNKQISDSGIFISFPTINPLP